MTNKLLSIYVMGLAFFAWQFTPVSIISAKAETKAHDDHNHEGHGHDEQQGHDHEDGHDETDGDDHSDDHSESGDTHDDHGHDSHGKKDGHDDHGHGRHGNEHGEHEESKTEIAPDAAINAGVKTEKVAPATIGNVIPLTGRIVINQNTQAHVRARFPGIVRSVKSIWVKRLKKGRFWQSLKAMKV